MGPWMVFGRYRNTVDADIACARAEFIMPPHRLFVAGRGNGAAVGSSALFDDDVGTRLGYFRVSGVIVSDRAVASGVNAVGAVNGDEVCGT